MFEIAAKWLALHTSSRPLARDGYKKVFAAGTTQQLNPPTTYNNTKNSIEESEIFVSSPGVRLQIRYAIQLFNNTGSDGTRLTDSNEGRRLYNTYTGEVDTAQKIWVDTSGAGIMLINTIGHYQGKLVATNGLQGPAALTLYAWAFEVSDAQQFVLNNDSLSTSCSTFYKDEYSQCDAIQQADLSFSNYQYGSDHKPTVLYIMYDRVAWPWLALDVDSGVLSGRPGEKDAAVNTSRTIKVYATDVGKKGVSVLHPFPVTWLRVSSAARGARQLLVYLC